MNPRFSKILNIPHQSDKLFNPPPKVFTKPRQLGGGGGHLGPVRDGGRGCDPGSQDLREGQHSVAKVERGELRDIDLEKL